MYSKKYNVSLLRVNCIFRSMGYVRALSVLRFNLQILLASGCFGSGAMEDRRVAFA